MQDNDFKYRIELTKEEYEYLKNVIKTFTKEISNISTKELEKYLKSLCPEQNLNFEKIIKGKTYKVNTYFNEDSEYTILQILYRILRK